MFGEHLHSVNIFFTPFHWPCKFVCEDNFKPFSSEKDLTERREYWFNITLNNCAFYSRMFSSVRTCNRAHGGRPLLASLTPATSAFPEGFLQTLTKLNQSLAQLLSLKLQVDSCCRRSLQVSHIYPRSIVQLTSIT